MKAVSRRHLIRVAGGAAAGALATRGGLAPSHASTGTSAPSEADWRALASSLDGELARPGTAEYDQVRVLFNTRFDGQLPQGVVQAAGAGDVSEAVRFARRFELPVRPRAGGHSYVGDSTADGGLVIDVRPLRQVTYDRASGVARIGAGTQTYSLLRSLAGHGRAVPVGTCPTVGVAGLALGGGLGVESRRHGLTSDALIGLTMVTADGRIRRVGQGDGLLWAARGGGGGTFGIVTSLRMRTHAAGAMGLFTLDFPWQHAAAVARGWAGHVQRAPRSVWCNLSLAVWPDDSRRVRVLGRCRPGDEDTQAAAVERAIGVAATAVWTARKPYLAAVEHLGGGTTTPRRAFLAGSDVLPSLPDRVCGALAPLLEQRLGSGTSSQIILDPLTGAVQDVGPTASAFPWRRHLAELQWYVGFPAGPTPDAVAGAGEWLGQAHESVSAVSAGAYVNRIEAWRPPGDYFAGNLDRLLRLKARVDPTDLFSSPYTIPAG